VLGQLVAANQSTFIKGRCIQDNFRAVRLSCKVLHAARLPSILLKIDIAKAFDSVSWPFLLEVLQQLSFGARWRDWMAAILCTASTKILLNGVPGRRICHARGLRQGDPLSPMLFVLVMEAFNLMIRWLDDHGLLSGLGVLGPDQRISLFANDVVLFVAPMEADLLVLRSALDIFGQASGLFANMEKSITMPLHCMYEEIARVNDILACRVESFPSRYLGIPLSIFRLRRGDEQGLMDMVAARIPLWKGNLLNIADRTALVKSTLSAIPVHTAMAVCLSQWALGRIDKIRRGFIWTGTASASGGRCRVAWPVVCRPTELGGLGVADLQRAGMALCLRWPWLQRTDTRRPWLRLPDKVEKATAEFFKAATVAVVGDGCSTLFWVDNWIHGSCIRSLAPAVFDAVPVRRHGVTVAEALHNSRWVRHVTGSRSVRLIAEFVNLSNIIDRTILTPGTPNTFSWRLSADQAYSASSAYGAMFIGCSRPMGARQLWKTSAPPCVRLFFWLVMHGKCWTAHRHWRHGLQDDCTCILCD